MPDQVIDFSTLDAVTFNGTDLTEVIFNGTTIWSKVLYVPNEFIPIGDAGNTADSTTGLGGVTYNYSIAKTAEPLVNLKAYNADPLNASDQINAANYIYNISDNLNNLRPIINISYNEACRYVNWLNIIEGEQPAYNLVNGEVTVWSNAQAWQAGSENLFRHKDAKYFLPNQNEWYKAAFSKGSTNPNEYFTYATASNTAPTPVASGTSANTAVWDQPIGGINPGKPADVNNCGGLSRYGTIGQSGNVFEMLDWYNQTLVTRISIGGHWQTDISQPNRLSKNYTSVITDFNNKTSNNGFRVATAPVGTGA